jgi:hypothetical protein
LNISPFTVAAEAPTIPVLVSPADGSRGSSNPVFAWQDSFDLSGIWSYTLEVFKDAAIGSPWLIQTNGSDKTFVDMTPVPGMTDGTYYWHVNAEDNNHNTSVFSEFWSFIKDTVSPIITVLGNNPETVERGTSYTDAGATAVDVQDGNLTAGINSISNVDLNNVGTYSVDYSVTDSSGNTGTASRTVKVVDTTSPVLTLIYEDFDPTNNNTPIFKFNSTEAGGITLGGACAGYDTELDSAILGDNAVTLGTAVTPLADLYYHDCTLTVTDAAGNSSDALAIPEFQVDTQNPFSNYAAYGGEANYILAYYPQNGTWQNTDQTFDASGADPKPGSPYPDQTSGIHYHYCKNLVIESDCDVDFGPVTDGPITITQEGDWEVRYRVQDNAGNWADEIPTFSVRIDKTKPATTADGNGYAFGNWSNGNVSVALNCDDGVGLSGCKETKWCYDDGSEICTPGISGGNFGIYGALLGFTADGRWYLRYYSEDNAGNEEGVQSKEIKIDQTLPAIGPLTLTNYSGGYMQGSVEMSAPAADANGIADCEFRYFHESGWSDWVGGHWNSADGICYISFGGMTDGEEYELQFRAEDVAGNFSDPISSGLKTVDGEKPYFTDSGITSFYKNGFINLWPDIWAKIKDDRTTIQSCQYGVREAGQPSYVWVDLTTYGTNEETCRADDIPGLVDGKSYNFAFRGWDAVGNQSDDFVFTQDQYQNFTVDSTPPVTTASAKKSNGDIYAFGLKSKKNVIVTLVAQDLGAGVDDDAPKYCIDKTNACDPTGLAGVEYGAPFTISSEGTHYVRFYSWDSLGNREDVKSVIVKIDKEDSESGHHDEGDGGGAETLTLGTIAGGGTVEGAGANDQGDGGAGENQKGEFEAPGVLGTETENLEESGGFNWWWLLLVALLGLFAYWYFPKRTQE